MATSIKDHPYYERLRTVSLKEAATFVSKLTIEQADKAERAKIFREFGRVALAGYRERKTFGFSSDLGGEIARALEQAYQAGRNAQRDSD